MGVALFFFLALAAVFCVLGLARKPFRRFAFPLMGACLALTLVLWQMQAGGSLAGMGYGLAFVLGGCWITRCLLPEKRPIVRLWLGAALGLLLMMWLPVLFAFFVDFTLSAHALALLPLALLCLGAYLGRGEKRAVSWGREDWQLGRLLLCVALPLTVIGAYLQWTHNILPVSDGSLHVGQSTYGDLPLHLAIASSLRSASFPPDYNILPGALLTYPFLADSLSTSFLLLGYSLRAAIVFPGILMTALTFSGYVLLAARMADTKKGAALAVLFFFLNGGLGFLYLIDMQGVSLGSYGQNELQSVMGLWNRIRMVLEGWYQTPANHAEFTTYNLRWSNVIVDMMVPQRTTLAGWTMVIPCIYLLYDSLRPAKDFALPEAGDGPSSVFQKRKVDFRQAALLGLWAGLLPMVNTHCFLALGLMSFGWMAYDLLQNRKQIRPALVFWGVYGLLAVAAAAPQLFTWTFHQAVGNESFLQLRFNWVNNQGDGRLLDGYLWFYIKNIGLPLILILLALIEKNEKRHFLACGAFVIFLIAEFIQFQPNTYDNNKLFYIWYMVCCVIAADYALELLGKLKGLRARPVIAVLAAICCFFTGTLAVAREINSDYQMFSLSDVEAAEYVEEFTPKHSTFMTWTQHINFVSSLTGRNIVCGPDTWLVYHGFSTWDRQMEIRDFYENPRENLSVLEKYDVDYILVGNNERYNLTIDLSALKEMFECVYESDAGDILIFACGKER